MLEARRECPPRIAGDDDSALDVPRPLTWALLWALLNNSMVDIVVQLVEVYVSVVALVGTARRQTLY
jgi:hypothetical protein